MTGARSSPCHPAADTTCALTTGKAALLRAYKQFYMNTVVARLADTQTESLNQMEELVRRCEKMIREGQKGNAGNEQEKLSGQ